MKGALLFFVTIVLGVPSGRTALVEYLVEANTRFAALSPFSEIILALIGIVAVLLFLIMRQGRTEETVAIVWVETRGTSPAERRQRPQPTAPKAHRSSLSVWMDVLRQRLAWRLKKDSAAALLRLRRFLTYQVGAWLH